MNVFSVLTETNMHCMGLPVDGCYCEHKWQGCSNNMKSGRRTHYIPCKLGSLILIRYHNVCTTCLLKGRC